MISNQQEKRLLGVSADFDSYYEDSSENLSSDVDALQFLDVHLNHGPDMLTETLTPRNYEEHFLLSLTPSLSALDEREKNRVKTEILRIISEAHERSLNNKTGKN